MWPYKREPVIKPPPPVDMPDEAFREAQRRFIDKHDKIVKPDNALAVELIKTGADYGKLTVSYLAIGNGTGLAALLAIYPLIREGNAVWLGQQFGVAVAFGIGLFLAAATGAVAYVSYMGAGRTRWNMANYNAVWITQVEFGSDRTWAKTTMDEYFRLWRRGDRISDISTYIAVVLAIGSGGCWVAGALMLVDHLSGYSIK
jgi:hypothetical protein